MSGMSAAPLGISPQRWLVAGGVALVGVAAAATRSPVASAASGRGRPRAPASATASPIATVLPSPSAPAGPTAAPSTSIAAEPTARPTRSPAAPTPPPVRRPTSSQEGDTLNPIAVQFGTSVEAIRQANGLERRDQHRAGADHPRGQLRMGAGRSGRRWSPRRRRSGAAEPTARTRLAAAQVHLQELAVLQLDVRRHQLAQSFGGIRQHAAHGAVQAVDLVLAERAAAAQRRQLRLPQDLVRIRIADAGHELLLRSSDFSSPGWLRIRWRKASRVSVGVVRIGPHLGPAGDRVEAVGRDEVELAEHLAVDVAQLAAVGEAQAQPGAGTDLGLAVVEQPEAPGQHRVGGQHALVAPSRAKARSRNLPRRAAALSGGACQRGQLRGVARTRIGVGAVASSTVRPAARAAELLGHDGQIGKLRHAGAPLTVWYAPPAL